MKRNSDENGLTVCQSQIDKYQLVLKELKEKANQPLDDTDSSPPETEKKCKKRLKRLRDSIKKMKVLKKAKKIEVKEEKKAEKKAKEAQKTAEKEEVCYRMDIFSNFHVFYKYVIRIKVSI